MYIERFYNIIFCHCYSQNTADVKFEFYVVLKKYMKRFNTMGFLSLKCQNGSLMKKTKQTKKQRSSLFYAKSFIFKKFSDLINRDTKWEFSRINSLVGAF